MTEIRFGHLAFKAIIIVIFSFSCASNKESDESIVTPAADSSKLLDAPEVASDTTSSKKMLSNSVNFFLENSGSMNGYLNGNNDFKEAINRVIRNLELKKDLSTYYINTKSFPSGKSLDSFLRDLTINGVKGFGSQLTSDINAMFSEAITKTVDGSISILVSDGIYSIEGVRSEDELISTLKNEKLKTRNTLIEIIKERNLSAAVIQLFSQFKGTYYCANGKTLKINGDQRPYYMWVFGSPEALNQAIAAMDLKSLPGYENSWRYFRADKIEVDYSILTSGSDKVGSFQSGNRGSGLVTEIKDSQMARHVKEFGFAIALDLSHFSFNQAYLLDKNNYKIEGAKDSYLVKAVTLKENLDIASKTALKALPKTFSPSHVLSITSSSSYLGDISIVLENKQPNWITQAGTDDDSELSTKKTFGFQYLMEGFSEAYSHLNKKAFYFKLPLNVNK